MYIRRLVHPTQTSQTWWKPNFCVQIPIIPQPSSRMMANATVLNIVLVSSLYRCWMVQYA